MREDIANYEDHWGGSLPVDASSYVMRQADSDFYTLLKAGQFCYVLNSRQMGKSSLRVRTMQRLQAEGFLVNLYIVRFAIVQSSLDLSAGNDERISS